MSDSQAKIALVPSAELFSVVVEAFQRDPDATVAFTPSGTSMLPTLRDRLDVVYLVAPTTIKKYDVALFRRDSGEYVLHRVVRVERDGTFDFRGDNQFVDEKGVRRDQILAVVRRFKRKNLSVDCQKSTLYKIYVRVLLASAPLRRVLRRLKRVVKRAFRFGRSRA